MSERVQMMDCGDGIRRADNACFTRQVVAKTASFSVVQADSGKLFTNRAAAGAIVATLPAVHKKGTWVAFAAPTAQTFTITATGGAKIDGSAANGSLVVTAGKMWSVVSDGTDWYSA